jgi:hypothetical protein
MKSQISRVYYLNQTFSLKDPTVTLLLMNLAQVWSRERE